MLNIVASIRAPPIPSSECMTDALKGTHTHIYYIYNFIYVLYTCIYNYIYTVGKGKHVRTAGVNTGKIILLRNAKH